MWEKLKKWFVNVFVTQYIIKQNDLLLWHVFYADRTETKYSLGQSKLLSQVHLWKGFEFSRIIKKAYTSNGLMSLILIKILIIKHGKEYKYKRIKAMDVVFVTDLTGITGN